MPPKRPNLVLPSHIPNIEFDILVRDGLDVEADSRDGSDVGVELELVEDGYGRFAISLGFAQAPGCRCGRVTGGSSLVFPAASKPSMSRRISLDPKILPMIFETEPPIVVMLIAYAYSDSRFIVQIMLLRLMRWL